MHIELPEHPLKLGNRRLQLAYLARGSRLGLRRNGHRMARICLEIGGVKLTHARGKNLMQETWYIDRLVHALTDAPYLALLPLKTVPFLTL